MKRLATTLAAAPAMNKLLATAAVIAAALFDLGACGHRSGRAGDPRAMRFLARSEQGTDLRDGDGGR